MAIAMLAALMLSASAPQPAQDGWRPLFDGRSLAGWTPKINGRRLGSDPARTFTVKDGAIRVSYGAYGGRFENRFGHLAYRTPYSAYRLRLEYRFYGQAMPDVADWQLSNSGVMIHGQPPRTMRRDQGFPVSLEVQLLGSERKRLSRTGNVCTPGLHVVIAGKLETTHCIESDAPALPNGRWIQAEVEVDSHGRVTHFIEGRPVISYSEPQYDPADPDAAALMRVGRPLQVRSGYIYLQSEGHPVEFRNIEIRTPPAARPGASKKGKAPRP